MLSARSVHFAALAVATVLPSACWAFTLASTDPYMKGWAGGEVQIQLNLSNCPSSIDVAGIANLAAAVWNDVASSRLKVTIGGSTTATASSNPPILYCETNFQSVFGADENSVPGLANNSVTSGVGISRGVIALNVSTGTARITNVSATLLTVILAHEIGHLIGLGHSQSSEALMYYDASKKTTLGLSQDDVDGVSYLYPRDEPGADRFGGCAAIAPVPRSQSGRSLPQIATIICALALPLALALGLRGKAVAHRK